MTVLVYGWAAERNRRAVVLESEGQRQSAINVAEGAKQSAILNAEGVAQSMTVEAEAQAKAITVVGEALSSEQGNKAAQLELAKEALHVRGKLAKESTTMIIPDSSTEASSMMATAMSVLSAVKG